MKLIVGITGASGAVLGVRVLEALRELGVETHLVLSKWGRATVEFETDCTVAQVRAMADYSYAPGTSAPRSPAVRSGPTAWSLCRAA